MTISLEEAIRLALQEDNPTRAQLLIEDAQMAQNSTRGEKVKRDVSRAAGGSLGGTRGVHRAVSGTARFPVLDALGIAMKDPDALATFLVSAAGSSPGFRSSEGLGKIARDVAGSLGGGRDLTLKKRQEQKAVSRAKDKPSARGGGFGPGPNARPAVKQERRISDHERRRRAGQDREFERRQRAADIRSELEIRNRFRNEFAKEILGMLQGLGNRRTTQRTQQVVNNAGRFETVPITTTIDEPIDFARLIQGLL